MGGEREKSKARLGKILTRRNSWPTAPVTPTMATEGPSAFFAARGARARDLPDVRLLLPERAAGLAAAPEEERDEESIWLKSSDKERRSKTESSVQIPSFRREQEEQRRMREQGETNDICPCYLVAEE